MRKDGRTVNQQLSFLDLLASHHTIDIALTMLDLDMNEIPGGDISARLEDGQVTVDADAEITRSLDLDLLDPTGALHLDTNSPSAGAMFADRMIRVRYAIVNPLGTTRYSTPIFTGPLTALDRDGVMVKVECQGKEIFGMGTTWSEKTWKKGTRATTIIKVLVRDYMGETHFNIPDLDKKIPKNVSVGGDKTPWMVAKQVAAMIGYQLYFDGMGVCQMRKMPKGSVFTFKWGPGGTVKTEPQVGFDIEKVVNAVEVWGKKPTKKKGKPKKARPHARVVAPRSHPLSPWKLGRKGGPRYLTLIIEDDSVENNAEAKKRAKAELARGLRESVEVAYDTLTIPHLEELDVVTVKTSRFSADHTLRQFVIGLRSGSDSAVGYVKNVKPNTSAIRTKKRKAKKRSQN